MDKFEKDRSKFNTKIDMLIELLEQNDYETRTMTGLVLVETGEDTDRVVHTVGMEAGKANIETILNITLAAFKHCCQLLCIVCGKDVNNPKDMAESYMLLMGHMHQQEDEIIGKKGSILFM